MSKVTLVGMGLDNMPGTLANLCSALHRANFNLEAVSVSDNAECCWVRLVASPTGAVKITLTKGRYNFCTQKVLRLRVPHRPGVLRGIAAKLAKAGVNIKYVYGSNAEGPTSTLVLSVDDIDRAATLLK